MAAAPLFAETPRAAGADALRVLYVRRPYPIDDWRDPIRYVRDKVVAFRGNDGYLRAALHATGPVRETSLERLRLAPVVDADVVVVNWKCGPRGKPAPDDAFAFLRGPRQYVKVLFASNDESARLPPVEVMDLFDVVVKRELYRDLSRYDVPERIKRKLCTTMFASPLVKATPWNCRRLDVTRLGHRAPHDAPVHDVFFSGKPSHPLRVEAWAAVRRSGVRAHGGIHPGRRVAEVPDEVRAPLLDAAAYRDAVRRSRINLSIDGNGELSNRHLEILHAASFMLANATLADLDLPIDLREGRDYVGFQGVDDMLEKMRHYLRNEDERRRIAAQGRRTYERGYDPRRHGLALRRRFAEAAS